MVSPEKLLSCASIRATFPKDTGVCLKKAAPVFLYHKFSARHYWWAFLFVPLSVLVTERLFAWAAIRLNTLRTYPTNRHAGVNSGIEFNR